MQRVLSCHSAAAPVARFGAATNAPPASRLGTWAAVHSKRQAPLRAQAASASASSNMGAVEGAMVLSASRFRRELCQTDDEAASVPVPDCFYTLLRVPLDAPLADVKNSYRALLKARVGFTVPLRCTFWAGLVGRVPATESLLFYDVHGYYGGPSSSGIIRSVGPQRVTELVALAPQAAHPDVVGESAHDLAILLVRSVCRPPLLFRSQHAPPRRIR